MFGPVSVLSFWAKNWTGPDFQALLTAAEIFDFHMYFALLKISDDNTEFTCSPGGKKKFPQVFQNIEHIG